MDSNEKNKDSVSVSDLDSTDVIIQPVEKRANSDAVKETIYRKLIKINSVFENKLKDIQLKQKRKISEILENINMEKEDSQSSKESVKRRRYSDSQNKVAIPNNSQGMGEKELYTILLTNSSGDWSAKEVRKFVTEECGVHTSCIDDSREENTDHDFRISLRFETKKELFEILDKLREKEAQGKLSLSLRDNIIKDESESDTESENTLLLEEIEPEQESPDTSKSSQDMSLESNNFYIRESYLQSLGIKPPITNWVSVTNFRCDKSELKEVLELAGKVLICSVSINTKYADVMYSHPLEALQAVSMLNGQQLYGKNLEVKMNSMTDQKASLPKGLADVGPGLGNHGKTLPDVGDQYKRFLKGKPSDLDACLFQTSFLKKIGITFDEGVAKFPTSQFSTEKGSQKSQSLGPVGQKPAGNNIPLTRPMMNSPIINQGSFRPSQMAVPNPMQQMQGPIRGPLQSPGMGPRGPVLRPMLSPGQRQMNYPMASPRLMYSGCTPTPGLDGNDPANNVNGMMARGFIPCPMGQMVGPRGPMVGPNRFPAPGFVMGQRPGPGMVPRGPPVTNGPIRPNVPFAPNVRMFKGPEPGMVQITNLPPTTNFVGLGQKLSEIGHVLFLELTTPGCANVRFASPADVDRCLHRKLSSSHGMRSKEKREVEEEMLVSEEVVRRRV